MQLARSADLNIMRESSINLRALRHGRRLRILTDKLRAGETVHLIDRGEIVATILPVVRRWQEDPEFDKAIAEQDTIDPELWRD
jgi:antitoxin (DNA-binding transcriptional repressor) of toxin-antitoxin stability system